MTDRETLYKGVSQAAWGYFLLYFDINLGTVSILPRFAGYLLFLSAIKHLSGMRRDLSLLRPLGILLALWNGADWLASWGGGSLDGLFLPLDLIVSVAGLYFHFQMFTDFAALAASYQQPGDSLDRRLLRWRTIQTLLLTAIALLTGLTDWLGKAGSYVVTAMAVVCLIVGLCLMAALFSLRKLFRDGPELAGPPAAP